MKYFFLMNLIFFIPLFAGATGDSYDNAIKAPVEKIEKTPVPKNDTLKEEEEEEEEDEGGESTPSKASIERISLYSFDNPPSWCSNSNKAK